MSDDEAIDNFMRTGKHLGMFDKRSKLSDLQSVKVFLCTPQTCYNPLPASEKWRRLQQKISLWLAQAE